MLELDVRCCLLCVITHGKKLEVVARIPLDAKAFIRPAIGEL